MNKFLVTIILTVFSILFIFPIYSKAITDPLTVPNNRFGVHILEIEEVFQAAKLINSSGGEWGYVTIPIRSDDRDKEKWKLFFKHCQENKVIPILRLATFSDKDSWTTPSVLDLVDFANFLTDLPWPVKNRYIILFNEPNHSKEWGRYISPPEYAKLLVQAKDIFKSRSDDFFLISGGLDMSAPSNYTSQDALKYYKEMTAAEPEWYKSVDGIGVHAYPNPAFSSSALSKTRYGITSYRYELSTLKNMGFSGKPIFITETGYLGRQDFYPTAFNSVWTEKDIVAITPFVLFAGAGEFAKFSLLDTSYHPTSSYLAIYNQKKIAGTPLENPIPTQTSDSSLSFSSGQPPKSSIIVDIFSKISSLFFKPKPKPSLKVGQVTINVEVADTPSLRQRGLSGRSSLPLDSGMLFTFPVTSYQTFWMKDMKLSLDFIWIQKNTIVQINENIPPPAYTSNRPILITSNQQIDWILEVNAGFVKHHGIKIGDTVNLISTNKP